MVTTCWIQLIRTIHLKNIIHAFSGSPLDRVSVKRPDAEWIADKRSAPESRFLPFCGTSVMTANREDERDRLLWLSGADMSGNGIAASDEAVFLGMDDKKIARFAILLDDAKDWSDLGRAIDLRPLAMNGTIGLEELSIAGQASSMLDWHDRHRCCARCGTRTDVAEGGYKRICPNCEAMHFPRVDPVVIMIAVKDEKCLLARSPHFVPGMYSALAGFIEPGESLEEATRREIEEETGIRTGHVAYHSSQPWPFPSSLMIGCIAQAENDDIKIDPVEIEDARWFARDELTAMRKRTHPDGFTIPFRHAIARQLIKAFLEGWSP